MESTVRSSSYMSLSSQDFNSVLSSSTFSSFKWPFVFSMSFSVSSISVKNIGSAKSVFEPGEGSLTLLVSSIVKFRSFVRISVPFS